MRAGHKITISISLQLEQLL